MNLSPGPIPPLVLVALTSGVLLAHALVVQNTAMALASDVPAGQRVFMTRTVQLQAPAPQTPAALPAPPARKAIAPVRKPAAPAPAAMAEVPAAAPEPVREPAAEAPVVLAQAPAAVTSAEAPSPPPAPPAPAPAPMEPPQAAPPAPATSTPAPMTAERPGIPLVQTGAGNAAAEPRVYVVPASTRLKFDATGMRGKLQYHASGELAWLHDGATYEARLQLSAFLVGARVLSSSGALTAEGLAPRRFGDKFRSETAAHFERDRGRVVFSTNTPEAVLLPGAQDQLSVFMQLAAMLAGEPQRYPPGSTVSMQTVGTRIAEPWTFTIDAPEKLSLPGGEQQVLKLTRLPRRDFDQKVELWLAPALGYLPARILITQSNGDFIDQQWRSTAKP